MSKRKKPLWLRRLLISRMIVMLLILAQFAFVFLTIYYYQQLRWVRHTVTALSVLICFHLLTRRDQKSAFKLSLIFLILLFPLFGGVLYCILQYQTENTGFRRKLTRIEQAAKCEYRRDEQALSEATASLPESRKLVHYLDRIPAFPVCKNTETVYFPNGNDMLDSVLKDIQNAQSYIFLEFFIIEEGKFWDPILKALEERAASGVDVRVIYDDMGCLLRLPKDYAKRLRAKGIQCKVFNPFRPFLTSIQNNRDHRKIIVVDGKVAYTGGINLADEYLGEKVLYGKWKDSAICLRGDGAWSFTVMFLQMWSFLSKKQDDIASYLPQPAPAAEAVGWVQPYCDSPTDHEHVSEQVYLNIIEQAHEYLYITTPYLTIDGSILSALKLCAKSGVDVRIITPHIPDKKIVHFTSRSYYRELIRAGVRIYEYTDGFIHAKNFLADGLIGTVGTVNLDFRSLYLHFECGTCLYRTPSLNALKQDYLQMLKDCREISERDCKRNLFIGLLQDICRIFAPVM